MRAAVFVCLFAVLIGCGKSALVENTTQKRAMQIVVALHKQGLVASASKESGGQGKYRVEVDESSYAQALEVVEREGLLDDPAPSFEELTSSSSFFPASREVEALRLDYALGLETKRLLEDLPGIEHAQVLVRKRYAAKDEMPPSVSAVLRLNGVADVVEPVVVELIMRSVPGVAKEQIFVSMEQPTKFESAPGAEGVINRGGKVSYVPLVPFVFSWRVPRDDYAGFAALFLTCIFAVGVVSVLFGYAIAQFYGSKKVKNHEITDIAPAVSRLERTRRDLLE